MDAERADESLSTLQAEPAAAVPANETAGDQGCEEQEVVHYGFGLFDELLGAVAVEGPGRRAGEGRRGDRGDPLGRPVITVIDQSWLSDDAERILRGESDRVGVGIQLEGAKLVRPASRSPLPGVLGEVEGDRPFREIEVTILVTLVDEQRLALELTDDRDRLVWWHLFAPATLTDAPEPHLAAGESRWPVRERGRDPAVELAAIFEDGCDRGVGAIGPQDLAPDGLRSYFAVADHHLDP